LDNFEPDRKVFVKDDQFIFVSSSEFKLVRLGYNAIELSIIIDFMETVTFGEQVKMIYIVFLREGKLR